MWLNKKECTYKGFHCSGVYKSEVLEGSKMFTCVCYDKHVHTMGCHASVKNDYANTYVFIIESACYATERKNQGVQIP